MIEEDLKGMKARCLHEIRDVLPHCESRLKSIDERMWSYAQDIVSTDIDVHNLEEVLALRKHLRMLFTYDFDKEKVQKVLKAYEMLKFSGLNGRQCYRLTPVQVFMLACTFGHSNGKRIITDANYYIPRKFGKTTISAFMQFWFFYFEDYNNEGYCVANSSNQSSILFKLTSDLVRQLDPEGKRIRFTKTVVEWKQGQGRAAKIEALSAGGKAKDGLFAGLCCADEYGSAAYVNEKSDMGQLVSVVRGSMGPRREPLTVTTTTAGRIAAGPFKDKLESMTRVLRSEMDVPLDLQPHPLPNDWQFALLLQPDEWERDEDSCRDPRVWRKVNPHIGVTVQEDFYRNEWSVMDTDEETKKENLCKLFNVYQSARTIDWVKPEDIRKLQVAMRVDDCVSDDDWTTFVGLDFSMGNDLHAISYLSAREGRDGMEFFADMDAYISEEALKSSPIKTLYDKWIAEGWLHLSPGATLEPTLPVQRISELYEKGVLFHSFGYDPYKAKTPINSLSAWVVELTGDINAPKNIILPVRQNYASYNPVVEEMDFMIKNDPALIRFSNNPLWGWEFGNVALDISNDGMENKKPVKMSDSLSCKVDNVQALLSALMLYDRAEGSASE